MSTDTLRTLESDIDLCVPEIQDLLAKILESRLGQGEFGITAICREFGLHRKLAWQIRSVAYAPNPLQAVAFVPARSGIESLTKAIKDTNPEIVERLFTTFDRFEDLVQTHAGDRTQLKMLVESNPGSGKREGEAKWREKAFQGNSFIWGAQARTQHSLSVLNASDSVADALDLVQVRGLIGLRRVRPNTRWIVGQSIVLSKTEEEARKRVPLDAAAAAEMDGVPILGEFCSQPLPQLVRRKDAQGLINDEIVPGPVGSLGEQNVVTGEVIRNLAPRYRSRDGQRALFGAISRTPSELFVYDHFVHKDLFPNVERELCVFSELNSPITQDDADLLPVSETIQHLGRGMNVARTPDVPGYLEMLDWVFGSVGWNSRDFDLYRVRLAFPPMPATVVIRHDLPAPDEA